MFAQLLKSFVAFCSFCRVDSRRVLYCFRQTILLQTSTVEIFLTLFAKMCPHPGPSKLFFYPFYKSLATHLVFSRTDSLSKVASRI